jgi:CheY-like chemotaxis protein
MRDRKWLLIADDDEALSGWLCGLLRRLGYAAVTARSGEEAVAALRGADFDYLITDVCMPGLDGVTLFDWVRRYRPHTATIVMSAYCRQPVRRYVLQQGAVAYLLKPVDPHDLIRVLDRARDHACSGDPISGDALLAYLMLLHQLSRTALIEVAVSSGETGRLHLAAGELLHAELAGETGADALERIAANQVTKIALLPGQPPRQPTIDQGTPELLLEIYRRLSGRARASLDEVLADRRREESVT